MNSESPWATKRPIPFTNVSGETIPAFAVMAITGVVYENGIAFLLCDKPSTVFVRDYAVNNMFDVPASLRGTCFRGGDLRALYDDGSPGAGEGWGPKPGQWSLSRGYPGFSIGGVVNSQHRIAKTFFEPITRVLVRTTDAIAAGATSSDYRIYAGTLGSETDAGLTIVPPARNRSSNAFESGEWGWLFWFNDGWELVKSGKDNIDRVWHGWAAEDIVANAVGNVYLFDGSTVSATNWNNNGVNIANGDYVFV